MHTYDSLEWYKEKLETERQRLLLSQRMVHHCCEAGIATYHELAAFKVICDELMSTNYLNSLQNKINELEEEAVKATVTEATNVT